MPPRDGRLATPLLGRHLPNPTFMAPALRDPIDMDPARLAAMRVAIPHRRRVEAHIDPP